MAQIGNIPQIKAVKNKLGQLQEKQLIAAWELPYEEILTRLTAAVFFLTPAPEVDVALIWKELALFNTLQYSLNEDKMLSQLTWRVQFNRVLQHKEALTTTPT